MNWDSQNHATTSSGVFIPAFLLATKSNIVCIPWGYLSVADLLFVYFVHTIINYKLSYKYNKYNKYKKCFGIPSLFQANNSSQLYWLWLCINFKSIYEIKQT